MFKNYMKIALRNLWKNRVFTAINLIGLSVAFGVATLLTMNSVHDLATDGFHENGDSLFLTYITWQIPNGTEVGTSQPTPFARALHDEVPGIARTARVLEDDVVANYQDKELNMDILWTDASFLEMFSFPSIKGKDTKTLRDISSVVLTEEGAQALFGEEEAIGKTVNVQINGADVPFTVRDVIIDCPDQSTMDFQMVLPFEKNPSYEATKERWGAQYHEVYVQLQDGVAADQVERNSHAFTNLHYSNSIEGLKRDGANPNEFGNYLQLGLLPIKDIAFTTYAQGRAETSRSNVYLILGIAFVILFIASVNFINMSLAKSAHRLREIGMRKTLGADKKQLFFQFWGESLFVFGMALALGLALSGLALDEFQTLFRTSATFEVLLSAKIILATLGIVLLITLIVGGYPATLLSRLGTIQSLKGKLELTGKNRVRDALIVLQFSIAILLISGTLILWGQVDFMRNKDLGFDKAQVLSFPLEGKRNSYDAVKLLREELRGRPEIVDITAADNNLGRGKDGSRYTSVWGFGYKGKGIKTNTLTVDYDYVKTLGLELVEGRDFDTTRENDKHAVLINERMAQEMGEDQPLTAFIPVTDSLNYQVIGVLKDYNFQDLSKSIEPLTLFLDREEALQYAYVRVAPNLLMQGVEAVEAAYKKIEPNALFLGSFLDENVDRTFRKERNIASLITSGSIIAIVLSCIGLFAMSLLIVNERTKEIGIRKVIGASVGSITYILTKDFLRLVFLAFLIASPAAWWFAQSWLQQYTYRIDLDWSFFALAGLFALIIALLTISTRTIKAAVSNPLDALRNE
ncbi:ABC transporter permease [Flagellimonas sp. DF-77]|uniref:ABC transporter permease n=1 Tax=Flagellimonas algarum TaxID=3230298 RepID=UPI003397B0E1